MTRFRLRLLSATVTGAVLMGAFSACSTDDSAASTDHNDADVTFASDMICTTSRPSRWPRWLTTRRLTPQ